MPAATNAIPNHASNPPTRSPSSFPVNSVNMKVTELVIGTAKERSGSIGVVLKAISAGANDSASPALSHLLYQAYSNTLQTHSS